MWMFKKRAIRRIEKAPGTLPEMTPLEARQLLSAAPLDSTSSGLTGVLGGKLPYSAIAGQNPKITQRLLITNSSQGEIDGYISAKLYLSADNAVDASSIPIGSYGRTLFLRPYQQKVFPFKVLTTPVSTPANDYQVIAQITDPNGNITYADSGLTIAITPPNLDLSGSFTKTIKPGKGGKTKLTFNVTNNGNIPANGLLDYEIENNSTASLAGASDITNPNKEIHIKPGKSAKITATVILPAGTYDIVIDLDPNNTLGESNVSNNIFSAGPITVG